MGGALSRLAHLAHAGLLCLLVLAACQPEIVQRPLASRPSTQHAGPPPAGQVTAVELADLAENPAQYEGARVQVSGEFRPLPVLVCDDSPRPSPAGWSLVGDGAQVEAAGFDDLLQPLSPTGLSLTVEGVWLRWQGPMGCGKQAASVTLWYLLVNQIVSPNPIARVTAGPGATAQVIAQQPTPTATPETPIPENTPTATNTLAPIPSATLPSLPPTPVIATLTPTPITGGGGQPTGTPTPTLTLTATSTLAAAEEPTETATPNGSGTPTLTPTPSPTGSVTSAPPGSPTDQGLITPEEVSKGVLTANESHAWTFTLDAADVVTISLAAALDMDVVITVKDPAGTTVIEQNGAGVGQPEMIGGLSLDNEGDYQIIIREVSGQPGPYAVGFTDMWSIGILFPGTLNYGDSRSASLPELVYHFWHFEGTEGDVITIVVAPGGDVDFGLVLYDPEMNDLELIDEGYTGSETLDHFDLHSTGLYSLQILEWYGDAADYQITLTRN